MVSYRYHARQRGGVFVCLSAFVVLFGASSRDLESSFLMCTVTPCGFRGLE